MAVASMVRSRLSRLYRRGLYAWVSKRRIQPSTRHHKLPGKLVVSLTSYAPRFPTILPTIKSLLSQSVQADRTILWVSHRDYPHVPKPVMDMTGSRFEVRATDDLKVYTKIIPALREFPEAFIVTADDDCYYEPKWLEGFEREFQPERFEVICRRAHEVRLAPDGSPAPYRKWGYETETLEPSRMLLPTGVAGVMYRPGILSKGALDAATFKRLSPTADDLWLFWMARRNGATFRRFGPPGAPPSWPSSQVVSLYAINDQEAHGNDHQVANLFQEYGLPD